MDKLSERIGNAENCAAQYLLPRSQKMYIKMPINNL